MHGRVKVRTPEEQAEAKRRENEVKVKAYREIIGKIFAKRSAGELDDEALSLTKQLLSQNPDIATLWNYRREILEAKLPSLPSEEATKLCRSELSLLELCLRVNPKSYGVWLHRQWVVTHAPMPDWATEKKLCDLFLKYDERNFHCWDYRRFVISKADVTPQQEFDFTYEKIAANFSNYSAWHYRSKLLPLLHPSQAEGETVAEEALLKEYELVQNAFFTDPSDQSAWLYHRWLLGKVKKPLSLACVLVQTAPKLQVYVVFNNPVKVTAASPIELTVGGTPYSAPLQSSWPEALWVCPLPDSLAPSGDEDLSVTVKYGKLECTVTVDKGSSSGWQLGSVDEIFSSVMTTVTSTTLQSELESCLELLQLEPDNKWCILTSMLLMQALSKPEHHERILELMKKLLSVDPLRHGYYRDLMSKYVIEQSLRTELECVKGSQTTLDLTGKELSRLYYPEHMLLFETIDVSGNQLLSLCGVSQLCCVQRLLLDDNLIEELPLEMAELQQLRKLSLRNNKISRADSLKCLAGLQLSELCLAGNPVLLEEDGRQALRDILPPSLTAVVMEKQAPA